MKNNIRVIFLVLFLYLFLFFPPFWIFRGVFYVTNVISLIGVLLFIENPAPVKETIKRHNRVFYLLLYLLLYSVFSIYIEGSTQFFTQHLLCLINCFLVLPQFLYYAKKKGICSEDKIVRYVLITISIAAIISIVCVMVPSINQYVKYDLIQYSQNDFLFDVDFRGFGFASELTGNYGFILGFVTFIGIFYLSDNKWFLFVVPLILFAALLNARTGVVIAGVCYAIYVLTNIKKIWYSIPVSFMALMLVFYYENIVGFLGVSDETLKWLSLFEEEVEGVASTGNIFESDFANYLLKDVFFLPENAYEWLFGKGFYLFRNKHGLVSTDNGWSNELCFGGLFYMIPLLVMLILILRQLIKNKGIGFGLAFLLMMSIVNTKTILLPSRTIFYLVMLLLFVTTPNRSVKKKSNSVIVEKNG